MLGEGVADVVDADFGLVALVAAGAAAPSRRLSHTGRAHLQPAQKIMKRHGKTR